MEGVLLDELRVGGFKIYYLVKIKIDGVSLTLVYDSLQRPAVGFIIPRCFPDKCNFPDMCDNDDDEWCDNDDDECKECIVPMLADDAISFNIIRDGNNWIRVAPLDILPSDIYKKVKNLVMESLPCKVKLSYI